MPPKLTSTPSRHYHQRERGPRQKKQKLKNKKKEKTQKYTIYMQQKPNGEDKAAHFAHTNATGI